MGYPYDKTYLEEIQAKPKECERIRDAFYTLRRKFIRDNKGYSDAIDLSIKENFALLGEAFELASDTVGNIADAYHFMWDVLDELIPEGGKK